MIEIMGGIALGGINYDQVTVQLKEKPVEGYDDVELINFYSIPEDTSKLKEAMLYPFGVSEKIFVCQVARLSLIQDKRYSITGECGINTPVHISKNSSNSLKKNEIAVDISYSPGESERSRKYQVQQTLIFGEEDVNPETGKVELVVWIEITSFADFGTLTTLATLKEDTTGFIYALKKDVVIPEEQSEPVRYWYNGVSYIDINNVWIDKTVYPQAILEINNDLSPNLILCENSSFNQENGRIFFDGEYSVFSYIEYPDEGYGWHQQEYGVDGFIEAENKVTNNSNETGILWSNSPIEGITSEIEYTTEPVLTTPGAQYTVSVRGERPSNSSLPVTLTLITLWYDEENPPTDFIVPSDGDYSIMENLDLLNNINFGIEKLENGEMEINYNDNNFNIFYNSLISYGGNSISYEDTETTYSLNRYWGKKFDENRILIWCASLEGTYGDLTIDDFSFQPYSSEEGGGAECLAGDTLITMADGTTKEMQYIKPNDLLLSRNGKLTKVLQVRRGTFNSYHTLYYFDNGTIIDETHEHRFFNMTQGFWQRLKCWNIGDIALDQNGNEVQLIKKKRVDEKAENFGIFVESGNYYANGLLSGEAWLNKPLLAEASIDQAVDMMLSVDERQMIELMGVEELLL